MTTRPLLRDNPGTGPIAIRVTQATTGECYVYRPRWLPDERVAELCCAAWNQAPNGGWRYEVAR